MILAGQKFYLKEISGKKDKRGSNEISSCCHLNRHRFWVPGNIEYYLDQKHTIPSSKQCLVTGMETQKKKKKSTSNGTSLLMQSWTVLERVVLFAKLTRYFKLKVRLTAWLSSMLTPPSAASSVFLARFRGLALYL
jgi:hypothetical protein